MSPTVTNQPPNRVNRCFLKHPAIFPYLFFLAQKEMKNTQRSQTKEREGVAEVCNGPLFKPRRKNMQKMEHRRVFTHILFHFTPRPDFLGNAAGDLSQQVCSGPAGPALCAQMKPPTVVVVQREPTEKEVETTAARRRAQVNGWSR